ncbi:MAG: iojap-like ribosome-associated protein [Thermoleophilia bacterium]|nr:iojap-like ribosome-associated protein [Thermoleophilia bacterium]
MTNLDTAAFARTIAKTALEKLAADVRIVDLREVVSYTDFFVICTGSNTRQTKAICDHLVDEMRDQGFHKPRRRESDPDGTWMLLDYVDVVVHVFTPDARDFYRLDTLWGQVPQETITEDGAEAVAPVEDDLSDIPDDSTGSEQQPAAQA